MDEDLAIINSNTRFEKFKNFFFNNKKKIIFLVIITILLSLGFFGYNEIKKKEKVKVSNLYNSIIIDHSKKNEKLTATKLEEIIKKKDPTYSPLSLYFIIDNNLILEKGKINQLFDIVINDTALEDEIKNLIIYKKGLFNADKSEENELLEILNPLINSKSIWKSQALYLMAEYFYSKNEKQKSKEFFEKILTIKDVNQDIIKEVKKRLTRDLSE